MYNRSRQRRENGPNERASVTERLDVDRDLAFANQKVDGFLNPLDGYRFPAWRLGRAQDDLIAFDAEDPAGPAVCQRFAMTEFDLKDMTVSDLIADALLEWNGELPLGHELARRIDGLLAELDGSTLGA